MTRHVFGFPGHAVACRAALVGDDPRALESDAAYSRLESILNGAEVTREPVGEWVMLVTPVDQPGWSSPFNAKVADEIEQKRRDINGHVVAAFLVDSAFLDEPLTPVRLN